MSKPHSDIFLAGHSGYIGTLLTRFSDSKGRYSTMADLSKLNESSREFVIVNAIGTTPRAAQESNDVILENYFSSNYEPVVRMINHFRNRIGHFIQISSSLIEEKNLVKNSQYLQSKVAAENYLLSARDRFKFDLSFVRLPSIWSKDLIKGNSLLFDMVKSRVLGTTLVLKNKDSECHISNCDVLDALIDTALQTKELYIKPSTDKISITTSERIKTLIELRGGSAPHPKERDLIQIYDYLVLNCKKEQFLDSDQAIKYIFSRNESI